MAESDTAEIAALKQEVIRLKQIVITMKYDIDNIDGDVMSLEDRITILEADYTPQQQVRHLTQGEVAVMDRALLRSTRLVHAGELAPASIAELLTQCQEQRHRAQDAEAETMALLARLQEPDVLPALRRAIVAIKSRPVSTGRDFAQEDQDARDIAALTKVAEMLK